jgi:hypothetical protein
MRHDNYSMRLAAGGSVRDDEPQGCAAKIGMGLCIAMMLLAALA